MPRGVDLSWRGHHDEGPPSGAASPDPPYAPLRQRWGGCGMEVAPWLHTPPCMVEVALAGWLLPMKICITDAQLAAVELHLVIG